MGSANGKLVTQKKILHEQVLPSFPRISVYESKDKEAVVRVALEAFTKPADPMFSYVVYDEGIDDAEFERRMQLQTHYMLQFVMYPILARGIVIAARDSSGEIVGCAAMIPPGLNLFSTSTLLPLFMKLGLPPSYRHSKKWGTLANKRLFSLCVLEQHAKKYEKEYGKYWYVQAVGTKQEVRGQGFGGDLLKTICRLADATNHGVYLETESEANEAFYRRYGFETLSVVDLTVANEPQCATCKMWLMLRKASNTSTH